MGKVILIVMIVALGNLVVISIGLGRVLGTKEVMREAYERGYAYECAGVTGYHWECGEEDK